MIYLNNQHLYYFQAVAQEGSIAQYYLSQYDLAELDMNKAIEVDTGKWEPNDLYRKLWIFLAQEKKNKSGRAYIKSFRGELKRNHWPDSLFLLYTGEMTVDQLQVIPKKRDRTQLCQAHFYTGVFHKMERRYEEAKTAFEDAQKPAEDCIEMHAAEFELADLTSRE